MNTQQKKASQLCIEDLERMAWFARLALGQFIACPQPREVSQSDTGWFEVLP